MQEETEQKMRWLATLPRRVSSATLIMTNDADEALIVKAHYKPHWTFPGGVIDPGETPLQAACRETREEVGIVIDPSDVSFVLVADRRSIQAETYQFVFKATTPLEPDAKIILQKNEIAEYAFVSREQVLAGDRYYGKVITHWAQGVTGYVEQTFGK